MRVGNKGRAKHSEDTSVTNQIDEFRQTTRNWLAANCPEGVRGPGQVAWGSCRIELAPDVRLWLARMAEKGWTVPTWPKAYGGAELDKAEYQVLISELKRIRARTPLTGRGVNYIGPPCWSMATKSRRPAGCPASPGAKAAGRWVTPNRGAGSDLASLSTRAVRDGDHFVINGRKIWTSDAMDCDYIFVLVRTNPDAPKHQGISLILVDMHQPGVQVRPIRLISGASPFNETLFEDAIAPASDLVGGIDNGWTVGKRLLQFERSTHAGINISGSQGGRSAESHLPEIVKRYAPLADGVIADLELRMWLIQAEQNGHAQRLTKNE